ncbi:MAG: hypothetical protein CSB34_02925 [Desulfobulbus propionicus]|nr:MAG: hypothetical protein CSB34_02925 [Desulfobulbus propionicus]
MNILLVFDPKTDCSAFKQTLQAHAGVGVTEISDVDEALAAIKAGKADAVAVGEQVGDMEGVKFIEALVKVNPMVNTCLVSALSKKDFHEVTEGLGVLMQLQTLPAREDAERFIEKLRKVASLM